MVLISTFGASPLKVVAHAPTAAVIENNQRNVQWPQDYCAPLFEAGDEPHSGFGGLRNTSGNRARLGCLRSDARNDVPFSIKSCQDFLLVISLKNLMNDALPILSTFARN